MTSTPGDRARPRPDAAVPAPLRAELEAALELSRQGDHGAAEARFRALAAEHPAEPFCWEGLGSVLWALGRYADALTAYQEGARLHPWSAAPWCNVGLCLRDLGRRQEALEAFRVALLLDAQYAPAWNEWGNVMVDLGRPAEAEPLYYRSLAFDGSRAVVHHNLGVCLGQLGRRAEAERCFRRAIGIDPGYVHSLEELGILRLGEGDLEGAALWLQRAGTRRAEWFLGEAGIGRGAVGDLLRGAGASPAPTQEAPRRAGDE